MTKIIHRFGKLTECDPSLSIHRSLVTTSIPYFSRSDLPRLSVWVANLWISLGLRVGRSIEKQRSRLGHHPRPLRNRLHRTSRILSPSAPPTLRSIRLDLTKMRMLTDCLFYNLLIQIDYQSESSSLLFFVMSLALDTNSSRICVGFQRALACQPRMGS
jgi:hypothetical protein